MRRFVGWLVVVAVVAASSFAFVTVRSGDETYTVRAILAETPNLFEGNRVMVRGVEVGEITSIEPGPSGVEVELEIRSHVKVPADARLAVVPVTVIADRYVQLVPAYDSGPVLEEGDEIALERTSTPAELDDVMEQLQGLLQALEPRRSNGRGALARLIDSLDRSFSGRSGELAGTLEGSATVLENLADSDADIASIISNLDRFFFAVAQRASDVALVNERFATVAEALASDQDHLEGTIENIRFLSDEAASLVDESGEALGRSFGRVGRVLRTVLRYQDELEAGIRWSSVISQALGATDKNGRGLNAYTGRRAKPGTPAAAYNFRLDTRDTITCERINKAGTVVLDVTPAVGVPGVVDSLLSYIPDAYDPHLRFLLEQLVPYCVDAFNGSAPMLRGEAVEELRALAEEIGPERFGALVGRWFAEGFSGSAP